MGRGEAREGREGERGEREPKPYKGAQPGTGEYLAANHLHKTFRQVGVNDDPRVPALRNRYYAQAVPMGLMGPGMQGMGMGGPGSGGHHGPTRNALPPGVKPQKCRFWPHCIKDDCNFVHPTRLCAHFPNCHHGDACLYIHPACAFGPNCQRRDCRYSHSHFQRPAPIPSRRHLAPPLLHKTRKEREGRDGGREEGKDDDSFDDDVVPKDSGAKEDKPKAKKKPKEKKDKPKKTTPYQSEDDD